MHGVSRWHSLDYSPRAGMLSTSIIVPTRNVAYAMAFDRSFRRSLASLYIANSEHRWSRLRCSPLRLTTASVFGSIDCARRLACAFRRHRVPCGLTVSARSVCTCNHKLSSHLHFHFPPKPPAAPTDSGRSNSSVPRNLRLLFRAVDDGMLRFLLQSPLSHTDSHAPPTHRGRSRQHSKPPAVLIGRLRRIDYTPAPKVRTTWTASLRQWHRPLRSLRVCLRLRARAGRQTDASRSSQQIACRSVNFTTPAVCSNPDVGTPSSLRSFDAIHLRFAPCVITALCHIKPLASISVSSSRESGGCRKGQFPRCGNLTFTAAILPPVLHIPRGRKGGRAAILLRAVGAA